MEEVLVVAAPHDRLEVDDVGGRDGGGVDERGGAVRRLRARRVVGDERGPLLGQPHELVRRVVEAGVHAVLEVGRRRYLHLLLLLGEHFGTMRAVVGILSSLQQNVNIK